MGAIVFIYERSKSKPSDTIDDICIQIMEISAWEIMCLERSG